MSKAIGFVHYGLRWNVKDIMNYIIIRMFYNLGIHQSRLKIIAKSLRSKTTMTPTRELNLSIMHASFSSKSHPSLNRPFTAQMTTYRPAFINMWSNQNVCSMCDQPSPWPWGQSHTTTVTFELTKDRQSCMAVGKNSLVSLNFLWSAPCRGTSAVKHHSTAKSTYSLIWHAFMAHYLHKPK